jgi:predicted acyltransferase
MVASGNMPNRSIALDVFRGMTVALMILVNNPGSWDHIYWPFEHAAWNGLTPTDLVFPFFLFAVGNAAALVLPKLRERSRLPGNHDYFLKVMKRTVLIFTIGFFLGWFPFFAWVHDALIFKSWTMMNGHGVEVGIRIMNVLQRIAVCYGLACGLLYLFPKRVLEMSGAILIFYWGLCMTFGHGPFPYSQEGFFGTGIDRLILGPLHLYQGDGPNFDPEGLMSSLPGIAQVMLGYWAGQKLREKKKQAFYWQGALLVGVGLLWSLVMPLNKKLWTSSYVMVTTGLALIVLALLVARLDEKSGASKSPGIVIRFFEAFGKNPLFIYVFSSFLPKLLSLIRVPSGFPQEEEVTPFKWFYEHVCTQLPGPPENGSLLYAALLVLLYGWIALKLDERKIYVRV